MDMDHVDRQKRQKLWTDRWKLVNTFLTFIFICIHREYLAADKGLVTIEPAANEDGIVKMGVNDKILQLIVKNKSIHRVSLRCVQLGSTADFSVDDRIHKIVSEGKTAELGANQTIDFTVKIGSSNPGIYCVPVAFMFRRGQDELFHIVKYVRAEIVDEVVQDLQPVSPYVKPKPVATVADPEVEIIPGEPPPV